jgi:hypothetical protein
VRKMLFYFYLVPLVCGAIVGCGGSSSSTHADVPVVVTMQDQPPAGLTVLSFDIEVTGVSLQRADGKADVSLLSSPVTVNLSNLMSFNTLLANTEAPATTYSGMTITFAVPQVSLLNDSGTTYTDGTNSCPSSGSSTSPCLLSPALTQTSVSITSSPFPLTLMRGTPVQMAIDFNSNNSFANAAGTLSITPSVSVTVSNTVNSTTNNIADFTNANGQVVSASGNQVVVTDLSTGQQVTLASNSSTTYNGFNTSGTCTTANTFACIQPGQLIDYNYGISGAVGSAPTLQSVNLTSGITSGVTGTVIGVNAASNQLEVLITGVSPAFTAQNSGLTVGQVVYVNPGTTATYGIQSNGATLPAGLSFASINDVGIGQTVLLDSTGYTAGTGGVPGTLTSDDVTLVPSQFNGTIGTLDASDQSFTVNGLNALYAENGIPLVTVDTGTSTTYTGITGGYPSLTAGMSSEVGGLLFYTPSGPVVVGSQVGVGDEAASLLHAPVIYAGLNGLSNSPAVISFNRTRTTSEA